MGIISGLVLGSIPPFPTNTKHQTDTEREREKEIFSHSHTHTHTHTPSVSLTGERTAIPGSLKVVAIQQARKPAFRSVGLRPSGILQARKPETGCC